MSTPTRASAYLLDHFRKWGWDRSHLMESQLSSIIPQGDVVQQAYRGWTAAERGDYSTAVSALQPLVDDVDLSGWAHLGLALVALRDRQTHLAERHLHAAESIATTDRQLLGTVRLFQGTNRFHAGEPNGVLDLLEESAGLLGPEHYFYGRVLDAIGMWYANGNSVQAALLLFQHALHYKHHHGDEAGVALTHGQLGRLYLDWGEFELAKSHFQQDLLLCEQIGDGRGTAQMHNLLGIVSTEQGNLASAILHIDRSVQLAHDAGWLIMEGFARKDRATAQLAGELSTGKIEHAHVSADLAEAQRLFRLSAFTEGLAHVTHVEAVQRRLLKEYDHAEVLNRKALTMFSDLAMWPDVARAQLELAFTLQAGDTPHSMVCQVLLQAVQYAENSRRPHLVRKADEALLKYDAGVAAQHVYQRVRGRAIQHDTTSFTAAHREIVSSVFFDLEGFTAWSRQNDPGVAMLCLNEMMAAFHPTMRKFDLLILVYTGDGFLAISKGENHARRAVSASLEFYQQMKSINRPRALLQLSEFRCRIGISTGEVVLGNIGTYDMVSFNTVGTSVNLAARIQHEAGVDGPSIDQATWEAVKEFYVFGSDIPRSINAKGIGTVEVWDVRKERAE